MKITSEIARTHTILEKQQEILARTMRLLAQSQLLRQKRNAAIVFPIPENLNEYNSNNGGSAGSDHYFREIIRIQEAERARISRELHDEFGQALTAIRLELELVIGEEPNPSSIHTQRIKHIKTLVERTSRELQRLAYDLRPVVLDDMGLIPALRSLGEDFSLQTGVKIEFDLNHPKRFSYELELALFRIAQEGLNNISKYAKARRVLIRLHEVQGYLELVIKDDGVGFDTNTLSGNVYSNGRPHIGIKGMRERLRLFGGVLIVRSRPGRGTMLRARVSVIDQQ